MSFKRTSPAGACAGACILATLVPVVAQDMADVRIKTQRVADGVYMLEGRGGNIGLSVGPDGVFMIDDQFAPLTEKILAAVAELSDKPVEFVVNTHWHGDHTGGNENLGNAGAVIVAHDNVRMRLSADQFMSAIGSPRTIPAKPKAALPVITFTDALTFHYNDDELHVFHVANAHTDGDAIIHFRKANAFHMGDTFFNKMYPFIDVEHGGTIDGLIAAADAVLEKADRNTRIIPGHGPLARIGDLHEYRSMLAQMRSRIAPLVAAGKTRDEVIAAKPTAPYDRAWGGGFIKPDVMAGLVFDGMAGGSGGR